MALKCIPLRAQLAGHHDQLYMIFSAQNMSGRLLSHLHMKVAHTTRMNSNRNVPVVFVVDDNSSYSNWQLLAVMYVYYLPSLPWHAGQPSSP